MKTRRHSKRQSVSSRRIGLRNAIDTAFVRSYGMTEAAVYEWIAGRRAANKAMDRAVRFLQRAVARLGGMSALEGDARS